MMDGGGFDARAFRNALGRFATGVTVVTAAVDGGVHGMTANAFTSVSLDPPLILVSIGRQARMHDHLHPQRPFGVSVLSQDQSHHAWHFAGRAQEGWQPAFAWRDDVPLIADALAHFVCRLETTYPGGDHTLFLARVVHLWHRDGSPLTFYRGHFFGLIPLPAGAWRAEAEAVGPPAEEPEISLFEPWW
jgi:flavin reductase (DIM6/NTAB) family NADH-FMN oxidoreductase RutF